MNDGRAASRGRQSIASVNRPSRLAALTLAGLVVTGTASALEFVQLQLERPPGVPGLMFDDRLCFPEEWLAFPSINALGNSTPRDLWLAPLTDLGNYLAGGGASVWVVAAQLRDEYLAAAETLRRFRVEYGERQAEGLMTFLDCVANTDPAVFRRYFDIAAGVIVDVDGVVARLVEADAGLRAELITELVGIGQPAVTPLAALLADPRLEGDGPLLLRLAIVRGLGQMGPAASEAAPFLVAVFGRDIGTVRAAARLALAQIGPAAVPIVVAMLSSSEPGIRLDAALTLGLMEPPPADALAALQTVAAADIDETVRSAAQSAAQRILDAAGR